MSDQSINEKTKVVLPVASWWQLGVFIIAMTTLYLGMKTDISAAVAQSAANNIAIDRMREQLDSLRMDQIDIKAGLGFFRQQYERDQQKLGTR